MKLFRRLPRDALRLGTWASLAALVTMLLGWTDYLDAKLADLSFTVRGPRPASPEIGLVAIDDATAQTLPRLLPLPREVLARLIQTLRQHGAAVIGLDVLLDEPTHPSEDATLIQALQGGRVVLATSLRRLPEKPIRCLLPLPEFTRWAAATGYTNPDRPPAADGVTRTFCPRTLAPGAGQQAYRSFPLALLETYAVHSGQPLAGLDHPARPWSQPWTIRYLGPSGQFFAQSAQALLEDEGIAELYRGKIVLIGATFQDPMTGERDAFRTPFHTFASDRPPLGGLELLAQATQTLLENRPIRPTSRGFNLALAWLLAVISAFFVLRCRVRRGLVGVGGLELALGGTMLGGFLYGEVQIGVALAMVSVAGAAILALSTRRARVEALVGRYASSTLVSEFLRHGGMPELGGETIEQAVVLFSDISGYVTLAEGLKDDPQALVGLLNEHFTGLTQAVLEQGGWVNNFMGDALLALFGVPRLPHPRPERDALQAVKAALAMRTSVIQQNASREQRGQRPLRIGIGLHLGPVVAGHIGAPQRMNYTVIGDAVNVAARLESLTREWFQEQLPEAVPDVAILISGELYARIADAVEAKLWREAAPVKNRPEPVVVYELQGLKTAEEV